jgi:hypothetical protein
MSLAVGKIMHAHAFEKQNVCSQRQTNSTVAVQSLEIDYYASLGVVRVMRVLRVSLFQLSQCFLLYVSL